MYPEVHIEQDQLTTVLPKKWTRVTPPLAHLFFTNSLLSSLSHTYPLRSTRNGEHAQLPNTPLLVPVDVSYDPRAHAVQVEAPAGYERGVVGGLWVCVRIGTTSLPHYQIHQPLLQGIVTTWTCTLKTSKQKKTPHTYTHMHAPVNTCNRPDTHTGRTFSTRICVWVYCASGSACDCFCVSVCTQHCQCVRSFDAITQRGPTRRNPSAEGRWCSHCDFPMGN